MAGPTEYWIQTTEEGVFNFADPKASTKITPRTIAHSLARLPRFNGHSSRAWYVAEHSILVKQIGLRLLSSPKERQYVRPYLLLHDAHEALTGDIPAPFKKYLRDHWEFDISAIQAALDNRIRIDLNLPTPTAWCENLCEEADIYALKIEREAFMSSSHDWLIDEVELPHSLDGIGVKELRGGAATLTKMFLTEINNALAEFINVG